MTVNEILGCHSGLSADSTLLERGAGLVYDLSGGLSDPSRLLRFRRRKHQTFPKRQHLYTSRHGGVSQNIVIPSDRML